VKINQTYVTLEQSTAQYSTLHQPYRETVFRQPYCKLNVVILLDLAVHTGYQFMFVNGIRVSKMWFYVANRCHITDHRLTLHLMY